VKKETKLLFEALAHGMILAHVELEASLGKSNLMQECMPHNAASGAHFFDLR